MKAIIFAVALSAVFGASVCAPAEEGLLRGSNCNFNVYADPNICDKQGKKIAIPCDTQCKKYYECDSNLVPQVKECGILKQFDYSANDCTTKADCNWYKNADTSTTTSSPTQSTQTRPTQRPPQPSTTSKPDGASATSAAAFLVSGAAMLLVGRNLF